MTAIADVYVIADAVELSAMATWRDRLMKVIEADGRSYRAILAETGTDRLPPLGHSFITDNIKADDPKEPSVENLQRLCNALNVSLVYILTGVRVTPEAEEVVANYSMMDEADRRSLLRLSRSMRADDPAPEESPETPPVRAGKRAAASRSKSR